MSNKWWKESVVYQIYPRSFKDSNGDGIGDLNGITSKVDYLKKLGVDVIWLSPVYQSPNDDNGYDISDYQEIMDDFGSMEDWERLLEELHKRDMKLMMDLVVNHSSDEHNWFIESRKSKDNPYRDYYIWRPGKDGGKPNNWKSIFSGSAWQYDEQTDEYYLHLFSKKQPDLNWENPTLRQEVYDMMTWWLDKGVDGFRMDVINLISKVDGLPDSEIGGSDHFMNGPRVHDYLQEMNQEVLSKYDVMTVGETPGATTDDAIQYANNDGTELNMIFTFEHMDLDSGPGDKWNIKPWTLADLKDVMSKWQYNLEGKAWNSLYLNNHDQPRMVSRFGDDEKYRVESAKMLATFLHLLKGTPYIYQGEELGMTNVRFDTLEEYNDIETLNMYREKVVEGDSSHDEIMKAIYIKGRDNARTPVQWDDSEHAGFTTGTPWLKVNPNYREINAEAALADPNSIFYYYQKLIQLRKKYDIIINGRYDLVLEENDEIYAYTRTLNGEKLLVLCNFTDEETCVDLPEDLHDYTSKVLIGNYDRDENNPATQTLKPYEAVAYLLKK